MKKEVAVTSLKAMTTDSIYSTDDFLFQLDSTYTVRLKTQYLVKSQTINA